MQFAGVIYRKFWQKSGKKISRLFKNILKIYGGGKKQNTSARAIQKTLTKKNISMD